MEAKLRNRQRDLSRFLKQFCPTLDKPRQKVVRRSLWGILQSGCLIVVRWLRWIPDRCKSRFSRHKRLLNQLSNTAGWDHRAVLEGYQRAWARHIEPDTPLIVDLSDLPRRRARKLKYLALVRDGSDPDHRLVNGYWCLEVYADLGKGRTAPLLLEPYSIEDPQVLGENAMILRGVDRVRAATEGRGVLVMDAGADRDNLLIPWIDDQRSSVVQLKGDRHLVLDDGTRIAALHLAETLLSHRQGQSRIASCRVYLPERPDRPLYLVCKTIPGKDRPAGAAHQPQRRGRRANAAGAALLPPPLAVRGGGAIPQGPHGTGTNRLAHVRGFRSTAALGDTGDGTVDVDAAGDAIAAEVAVPQVPRKAPDKIRLLPCAGLVAGADYAAPAEVPAIEAVKRVVASSTRFPRAAGCGKTAAGGVADACEKESRDERETRRVGSGRGGGVARRV